MFVREYWKQIILLIAASAVGQLPSFVSNMYKAGGYWAAIGSFLGGVLLLVGLLIALWGMHRSDKTEANRISNDLDRMMQKHTDAIIKAMREPLDGHE